MCTHTLADVKYRHSSKRKEALTVYDLHTACICILHSTCKKLAHPCTQHTQSRYSNKVDFNTQAGFGKKPSCVFPPAVLTRLLAQRGEAAVHQTPGVCSCLCSERPRLHVPDDVMNSNQAGRLAGRPEQTGKKC